MLWPHGPYVTSQLYTLVQSLHDLHSLGPSALNYLSSEETCTSVYIQNMFEITFPILDYVNESSDHVMIISFAITPGCPWI